jgi:ribose transport system ATP-binding protein
MTTSTTTRRPLLDISGLQKSFGATRALQDVSISIGAGRVHALIGQNGSGKSTLIKVLSGFHTPDEGTVEVRGVPLERRASLSTLLEQGIAVVHQDLGLVDSMSVVENLRVGRYDQRRLGAVNWRRLEREASASLQRHGLTVDPRATVASLTPAARALLAIARAAEVLEGGGQARPGLLVLDEPTAALPAEEVGLVLNTIKDFARRGHGVLLVTHHLNEVMAVADEVTVLRNGRVVGHRDAHDTNEDQLVELMLGHRAEQMDFEPDGVAGEPVLTITGLQGRGVRSASLTLRRGEIVGLTGLLGSGFGELPYVAFGSSPRSAGEVVVDGTTLPPGKPPASVKAGLALVPADRLRAGGVPGATVTENVTLPFLTRYRRAVGLHRAAETTDVQRILVAMGVTPADPALPLSALSGGNQQKALLGRWLEAAPAALMLHEPTQGIDVEARQAILKTIKALSGGRTGVLIASSQYDDVVSVCSRALIFHKGHLVKDVRCSHMTEDQLARECYEASREVSTHEEIKCPSSA